MVGQCREAVSDSGEQLGEAPRGHPRRRLRYLHELWLVTRLVTSAVGCTRKSASELVRPQGFEP